MATIRDVAHKAGVSVSTVSRVISSHPHVSGPTRERVLEVIETLHYRPSAIARGLVSRRTNVLGVIVSDISNPFYPQAIRGIEDIANEADYSITVANTDEDLHNHARAVDILREQRVDGIMLGSARRDDTTLASLFAGEVPVVLFNRGLPRARASQVVLNNKRGAEQATRHLADIGCKRLLHLAGPAYADNARARAQGFIRAAREAGYQDTDVDVVEIGFHPVTTNRVLDRLIRDVLSNIVPQTGVLAVYDVLAVRTMEIARYDLGLRIPDDIAIVGFDDTYLVSNRFIHLTTVSHHPYEMGAQAARLLVNRIEGRPGKWPQRVVLEPRLVSRGSTVADPDLWDERPHSARSSTASRA